MDSCSLPDKFLQLISALESSETQMLSGYLHLSKCFSFKGQLGIVSTEGFRWSMV